MWCTVAVLLVAHASAQVEVVPTTYELVTKEDGTASTFTVVCVAMPTADVTVPILAGDSTEGAVSSTSIVFTAADWDTTRTVTVTGVNDDVDDGDQQYDVHVGPVQSTDAAFSGQTAEVHMKNLDDDTAGLNIAYTGATIVTSETTAPPQEVVVSLQTVPTTGVQVPFTLSAGAEATLSVPNLMFTTANWATPQTLSVGGVDDFIDDGDQQYTLTVGMCDSADGTYRGLAPVTVQCLNTDDDTAGFTFSPSTATVLVTSEHLVTRTYVTVQLQSEPISAVSIEAQLSDNSEGTVSPADIRIAPSAWDHPHTYTITGSDDYVVDGDITHSMSFLLTESTDPNYDAKLPSGAYTVINVDNDNPGVVIQPLSLTVHEPNTTDVFTITLQSEPVQEVHFTCRATDDTEVALSAPGKAPADKLEWTWLPMHWNVTYTVTVHAVDDYDIDGVQTSEVVTTTLSTDPLYNGMTLPTVRIVTTDEDSAAIVFCSEVPAQPLDPCILAQGTTYEVGVADELYIRLATRPTADVVLTLNTTNIAEAVPSPLQVTFTYTNWAALQTVSIVPVDDLLDDGDVLYYVDAKVATADGDYASVSPPRWVGINIDDDVDECNYPNTTCTYLCSDTNINVQNLNDYTCTCDPPRYGAVAVGKNALCYIDECVYYGYVCVNSRQDCVDPNHDLASLDDWTCVCSVPATGTPGLRTPATCVYDECTDAYNLDICKAGVRPQECVDPNIDPESGDDWYCNCTAPGEEEANNSTGRAAVCILDECSYLRPCTMPYHTCVDMNTSPYSTGDWNCSCLLPTFPAAAVPLGTVPTCTYDECLITANSDTCSARSYQHCEDVDPDPTSLNDWVCNCTFPAVVNGTVVTMGPSACILDECTANQTLDVCTMAVYNYSGKGNGHGHAYHQTCSDLNTNAESLNDWLCNCTYPAVGWDNLAPAICSLDECLLYSSTCTTQGQACFDPNTNTHDTSSENDWWCECIYPFTGPKVVGENTTCEMNECQQYAVLCESQGQTCIDPDFSPSSLADWYCNCTVPFVGVQVGGVAECGIDECLQNEHICTAAGQVCNDTNTNSLSLRDWGCLCPTPLTGFAHVAPAVCMLDECGTQPCGLNQTCTDPNINITSRSDFTCECEFPSIGPPSTGSRTACWLDECGLSPTMCPSSQRCYDSSPAYNDWGCECVAPLTGAPVLGGAAMCTFDECTAVSLCASNDQECVDTNLTSLNDWMCRCLPPTSGPDTNGSLTVCTWDECSVVEIREQCEMQGQACLDPNMMRADNWECVCQAPEVGSASLGPATCTQDMCGPGNACAISGQDCVQTGTLWKCVCKAPSVGEQLNGVATCSINACTQVGDSICRQSDQECRNENNGWTCNCVPPLAGQPRLGSPANCTYDECGFNTLCEAKGQLCIDPNTSPQSTFDWMCACKPPSVGQSADGQLAVCTFNECTLNTVCSSKQQQCTDPNTSPDSLADWVCSCPAPFNGSKVAGVAEDCIHLRECADVGIRKVCEAANQTCLDSSDAQGDWQCVCPVPYQNIKATATAAVCSDSNVEGKPVASTTDDATFPWAAVMIPSIIVPLCVGVAAYATKDKKQPPPPKRAPVEDDEASIDTPTKDNYKSFNDREALGASANPFHRPAGRGNEITV